MCFKTYRPMIEDALREGLSTGASTQVTRKSCNIRDVKLKLRTLDINFLYIVPDVTRI